MDGKSALRATAAQVASSEDPHRPRRGQDGCRGPRDGMERVSVAHRSRGHRRLDPREHYREKTARTAPRDCDSIEIAVGVGEGLEVPDEAAGWLWCAMRGGREGLGPGRGGRGMRRRKRGPRLRVPPPVSVN